VGGGHRDEPQCLEKSGIGKIDPGTKKKKMGKGRPAKKDRRIRERSPVRGKGN